MKEESCPNWRFNNIDMRDDQGVTVSAIDRVDEYIYAQRVFILEQMPEGLNDTVQGYICMLLDTISH